MRPNFTPTAALLSALVLAASASAIGITLSVTIDADTPDYPVLGVPDGSGIPSVEAPPVDEPALPGLPAAPTIDEPGVDTSAVDAAIADVQGRIEVPSVEAPSLPEAPAAPSTPEVPSLSTELPALPEAPSLEAPSVPELPAVDTTLPSTPEADTSAVEQMVADLQGQAATFQGEADSCFYTSGTGAASTLYEQTGNDLSPSFGEAHSLCMSFKADPQGYVTGDLPAAPEMPALPELPSL